MTTYALRAANPARTRADAVIVGLTSTSDKHGSGRKSSTPTVAPGGEDVAKAYGRSWAPLLSSVGATGRAGEVVKVPTSRRIGSPLLVLVGLGPATPDGPQPDAVRRAAGDAARAVTNAASVAIGLPATSADLIAAATEGYLLGGYEFTDYKTKPGGSPPSEIVVLTPLARRQEAATAFDEARVVADAVAGARDWVNVPPADLTPPLFADAVMSAVKPRARGKHKVAVSVLDEEQLAQAGCGGILAVGAASAAPPRLVELRYSPPEATTHLALVGKGITFDSGGLSIKPGSSMPTMKHDMAGAAAVVRATLAIAQLRLPVRITAYAALAENMVSGSAMRPGDVVTIADGTTVEVANTDAEGRLVLADALVRAREDSPDLIVDVATLTGHMVVALGDQVAGVMGDEPTVERVLDAARAAGEDAWPMPIPEHMDERIRSSKIADLAQHDWIRWGGGLFAAAFLRAFTGGLPWAHLDIAGPAFRTNGASGHLTTGGTGYGVATLIRLVRDLAADRDRVDGGPADGDPADGDPADSD